MGTFAQMEQRIISELHRDDIASVVDDYINDAIAHYERFRFWFNEKVLTFPTIAGINFYDWPADFVELDSLLITVNGNASPLRQISLREMNELGTGSKGQPYCFALYQKEYLLYPVPDKVYTLTQYYLFTDDRIPLPTGSTAVTVWTTEAEELIRTRAKKLLVGQFMPTSQDTMGWASMLDKQENDLFRGLQMQTQASTRTGRLRSWDA